ncbi:MAG TPA: hypothetical protein VN851_14420 [Thermoanaerobaculia bacterium]|nr:hypothetical protein [Thermoanaerobaculia bacterium]
MAAVSVLVFDQDMDQAREGRVVEGTAEAQLFAVEQNARPPVPITTALPIGTCVPQNGAAHKSHRGLRWGF